ncbi:MAG: carbohydrate kinase, partial [Novosphingobium sp.]|nr:carbohydrate kinase [Novosphingobium sp.]
MIETERGLVTEGRIIVVDIGKTLSKVTLWSQEGLCLDRQVRPNRSAEADGIRRLDVKGIADWLLKVLASHAAQPIEAIIPVAHGAGVVALGSQGALIPPLDYEQPIPDGVMAAYRAQRDPFRLTGSPALPDGLNMGAQLFWLDRLEPTAMESATLVPWAQYWAWFLSGVAVSEVTSLGCHSDLWLPDAERFSPLAERMGWAARFAPMARAADVIGTLRPELARQTGLANSVKVLAGLHDSNAALLAARGFDAIARMDATVLSTGTWFIAMRLTDEAVSARALDGARDCLINVDVRGRPVPSARFMG